MRMLHWSSTSLGYMNPSMTSSSVPDRTVEAVVKELRASREMRLQDLHRVRFQKGVYRIAGIFQVGQLPRARGTCLATCGGQALRDPVITERAFIGSMFFGMEETASVRAGLDAIAAAQAIIVIDEHHSIGCMKSGADGAHLGARRIDAVVAHLGHEEVFSTFRIARGETIHSALR